MIAVERSGAIRTMRRGPRVETGRGAELMSSRTVDGDASVGSNERRAESGRSDGHEERRAEEVQERRHKTAENVQASNGRAEATVC